MAKLKIEIRMDSAAFTDGEEWNHYAEATEVARILRAYADKISADWKVEGETLLDGNGNVVGFAKL